MRSSSNLGCNMFFMPDDTAMETHEDPGMEIPSGKPVENKTALREINNDFLSPYLHLDGGVFRVREVSVFGSL